MILFLLGLNHLESPKVVKELAGEISDIEEGL